MNTRANRARGELVVRGVLVGWVRVGKLHNVLNSEFEIRAWINGINISAMDL